MAVLSMNQFNMLGRPGSNVGSRGYTITRKATKAEMDKYWADRGGKPSAAPKEPSISSEARSALQEAMARYKPGGGFGQGIEAGLQRGRTQALSSGMQNLVSSGLAGTTIAGGLGKKYEEEVAAPTRANLESIRADKLSALQIMLAQMEQSGYQAGLGRQFTASQSALNRGFQAQQAALGRGLSYTPASSYTPIPQSQPQPQPQPQPQLSGFNQLQKKPAWMQNQFMDIINEVYGRQSTATSAWAAPKQGDRTPGSYVGSINGQRFVWGEDNAIVKG